jgi:hypothetical protein
MDHTRQNAQKRRFAPTPNTQNTHIGTLGGARAI